MFAGSRSSDSYSDSDGTSATTAKAKRGSGIPKRVLKQLANDIEEAGGIQSFDVGLNQGLNILLDAGDSECYGIRGAAIRRQITNKVAKWKRLSPSQYEKNLFKLQVQPASSRAKSSIVKLHSDPKKRRTKRVVIQESIEEKSPVKFTWTDFDIVQNQILQQALGKAPFQNTTPQKLDQPDNLEVFSNERKKPATMPINKSEYYSRSFFVHACYCVSSTHPFHSVCPCFALPGCKGSNTIHIMPDQCGDAGQGLHCFWLWGHNHDHKEYEGVSVEIMADNRDVALNYYEMYFEEGTNKAYLTKPLMQAPFRDDKAEYETKVADLVLRKGHDHARAQVSKQMEKTIQYPVQFPTGYQLSQRCFAGARVGLEGETMKAKKNQVMYRKAAAPAAAGAAAVQALHVCVTWSFVNLATVKEMGVDADDGVALMTAGFAGL
jgi:hypothetical protein